MMDTTQLLAAALAYGARGWHVIPLHDIAQGHCSCGKGFLCGSPGKHPRLGDWGTMGSTDQAQITHWWDDWPNANVGVVTGLTSGLAVLDIDPRNGGALALEDFLSHYGPLPLTPMALTGGGGQHYYFTIAERLPGCKPTPGIDLQLDGQQVVAPPSLTTGPYLWEASSDPADVPLAPLPKWLLDLARAKAAQQRNGVDLPDELPSVAVHDLHVSARIKALIRLGADPDNPTRYPSRSEALFAVLTALVQAGHDDATMAAVIMDPRYLISTKVWGQKNPKSPFYINQTRQWVAKEIARAKAKYRHIPDMTQTPWHTTARVWTGSLATINATEIPSWH